MYSRKIYSSLKDHLEKKQITVLTGMRRTGKTTLLKELLRDITSSNKIYLDLERLDNRELFLEKNYDILIHSLEQRGMNFSAKAFILLDEIQLVKNIPSVLKYLYDTYNIKFIVTGSSSYYIRDLFTESLAGRKKIFELYPLDFGEFLTFKEVIFKSSAQIQLFNSSDYERLKPYYEEFIEYGGFPEVALTVKIDDKKDFLNDILTSYVNIDIKTLADFRRQEELYTLIKMLSSRASSRMDYSKLSRLAGLSRITLQNYIEFFEKTYLLYRVPVFTKNPDREIVKARKLYFSDNGFLSILGDQGSGIKFENALFCQLRHLGELRYYSTKNGLEIDFILNGKTAFEAKETPLQTDMNQLMRLNKYTEVKDFYLVGRHPAPGFSNFIWGGSIR